MKNIKDFPNIYKTIIEHLGEEIFVCDGKGRIIFVNPASLEVNQMEAEQLIGRNVRDLLDEGVFSDSSTLRVLENKCPVSIVQSLKDNRKVLATGVPVFDKRGNIVIVISTSKDVAAVNQLLNTIDTQDAQIETLRDNTFYASGFITVDEATGEIKEKIRRIAPLDIPVLVYGEVGVEKNQVAEAIHSFSERKTAPFINFNCFTIHKNSLESELFGLEVPSHKGESKEVKKGFLELANGGTLLISDIDQLPLHVQKRLHGYLETSQFTRVGGSRTIEVNTRIIATTCLGLKELRSDKGFFRELYYNLITVPIFIPPLSARVHDISLITREYISKLNSKYKNNKRLGQKALGVLSSYEWPGNIKELEHVVESAYILSDDALISDETVYDVIYGAGSGDDEMKIYCHDIIPLKKAKKEVEKQLVLRAYEIYKTTYKAAEVLGVNQSTISKILKKYR